jgi:hypothetical protein
VRATKAEKGVACQALATFDTLEQKAWLQIMQFQVRRYRRIEICGYVEGRG